jgi:hypothetical protein
MDGLCKPYIVQLGACLFLVTKITTLEKPIRGGGGTDRFRAGKSRTPAANLFFYIHSWKHDPWLTPGCLP